MLLFWLVCFARSLKCFGVCGWNHADIHDAIVMIHDIYTFVYIDLCVDILLCYECATVLVHSCITAKSVMCILIIF